MASKNIEISVSDFDKHELEIDFKFDWGVLEDVKDITGRQFDDTNEVWHLKLNERNLVEFLSFCQKYDLTIKKDSVKELVGAVKQKAQKKYDKYEKNKELATKEEPDLNKVYGLKRGKSLYPFQRVAVEYVEENKKVLIGDHMGVGKAGPLSSKLATLSGWKKMKDIEVGNEIIGSNGKSTEVTGVYPRGKKEVYEIKFSDTSVKCSGDHLWQVQRLNQKFRNGGHRIKKTKELRNDLRDTMGNRKWFIPIISQPVNYKKKDVPVDPYVLGSILGDGSISKNNLKISSKDDDLISEIRNRTPKNVRIKSCKSWKDYDYSVTTTTYKNQIFRKIRDLGLKNKISDKKFIPKKYKLNNVETRVEILQGLLDTDGTPSGSAFQYTSTSQRLAKDVQEIIWSLGGTARMSNRVTKYTHNGEKREGKRSYRLYARLPSEIEPFKLKRKKEKLKNPQNREPSRSIRSIEKVGREEVQCISVETEDNLYATDGFVLTHNTIETLGALEHLEKYPALIVCPASLKENWKNEVEDWLPSKRSVNIINASDDDPTFRRRVIIINYALLRKYKDTLLDKDWEMIVADESHYLKNEDSLRAQNFKEISEDVPYKLLLSGTPITNRPSELISQLKILDVFEEEFGGWFEYVNRFCSAHRNNWGWDISGASNLEELHEKLISTCYIRRNKEDVLDQLPEKSRKVVKFDIENRSEYRKVENNIVQYFRDKALEDEEFQEKIENLPDFQKEKLKEQRATRAMSKAIGAEHLVKLAELRKVTAKGKLKPITNWIDNFLKSEEKLILFAHHTAVCDAIEEKYGCLKITGEVPSEDRQEIVEKFQNDPNEQLIILNIAAGGEGITLTAASHVAFIELPWSPAAVDQAEARAHRLSQEEAVNIYYLLANDTIDEKVHRLIEKKRKVTSKVNAGKSLTEEGLNELEKESDITKGLIKELLEES